MGFEVIGVVAFGWVFSRKGEGAPHYQDAERWRVVAIDPSGLCPTCGTDLTFIMLVRIIGASIELDRRFECACPSDTSSV